jgi:hypothetical protein
MRRIVLLLGASFGLALAPAWAAGYAGPDACRVGGHGDTPVDKACNDGGVRAAKQVMRELVRRGKAQGVRFQCDDCHKDPEDFSVLNDTAKEKLKQLLAAAAKP